MFSLFLNDIEMHFQEANLEGFTIDQIVIYIILFADDAETKEGLQELLQKLESYCNKWKLTVNIEKTKIMVFRKGGQIKKDCQWVYAGKTLEIVSSFSYLGIVFTCGGSFQQATQTLVGKALRAMGSLFSITKGYDIPVKILLNLFDCYVNSILSYNCEVWGFQQAENIERVHRKFCKRILNVKRSTNSLALLSELGRFPLIINRYIRIIKYWLKLFHKKNNNCLLSSLINMQITEIKENKHSKNWSKNVKNLLETTGFCEIWLYPESVDIDRFMPIFTTRIKDIHISNWHNNIGTSTSMQLFHNLKTTYELSTTIHS